MKNSDYYNIGYRYGADNKIEYRRTPSPLISAEYTYVYHSNVLPPYSTNWYAKHIEWVHGNEFNPIPEHEVPMDIRAMNLLLIGE